MSTTAEKSSIESAGNNKKYIDKNWLQWYNVTTSGRGFFFCAFLSHIE